jgi:hypothetical protein
MDIFGLQYRAYGIDYCFSDPDEYVRFSKQTDLKFLLAHSASSMTSHVREQRPRNEYCGI